MIMLLSMILMHQLMIVPTNENGFLIYPILMGFWMEVNTVMNNKIKQLSLVWEIIVVHYLMRPSIRNSRLYAQAYYNGQPMPEGINIWWFSIEENILFFPEPNQSVYSAVQIQICMLVKYLATHESYKDVFDLEYVNDILSAYQKYRF